MSELNFVLGVTLITWLGVFIYLFRIDRKVKEAQRREEI
ncbi:MAG: CcmD family protein [Dethiobacter sp.]|jgi:CcmD family protein|nr:CcmD family protein [Dethiobacter sp.]